MQNIGNSFIPARENPSEPLDISKIILEPLIIQIQDYATLGFYLLGKLCSNSAHWRECLIRWPHLRGGCIRKSAFYCAVSVKVTETSNDYNFHLTMIRTWNIVMLLVMMRVFAFKSKITQFLLSLLSFYCSL